MIKIAVDGKDAVDFPHVMRQLGVDPFNGRGWEKFDAGSRQDAPQDDQTR